MHGRKRSDNRRKWKLRTAWLEKMQEQGKAGKIIKSVLKAHAGRKHRDGLNLDTVKDSAGTTYVTPAAVHHAGNAHFNDWYAMPDHYLQTLHTIQDWRPYLNDFPTFQAHFSSTQVPRHLMTRIQGTTTT